MHRLFCWEEIYWKFLIYCVFLYLKGWKAFFVVLSCRVFLLLPPQWIDKILWKDFSFRLSLKVLNFNNFFSNHSSRNFRWNFCLVIGEVTFAHWLNLACLPIRLDVHLQSWRTLCSLLYWVASSNERMLLFLFSLNVFFGFSLQTATSLFDISNQYLFIQMFERNYF